MEPEQSISFALELMEEFASRTGLSSSRKNPRRYLWTDAFAVCNFLELYRQTGDKAHLDLAVRLVDQVHAILGRHRTDDPRTGRLSGLGEEQGKRHPTQGGLRIGKELNERRPDEPMDERTEWDRDGQYFHYLTKWMHALDRMSRATGDFSYNRWAVELAKTAHGGFVYTPTTGGTKRMYWKMSIDLSHPLVPSMGQHDPLDGWITYQQLQATASQDPEAAHLDLGPEIGDMAVICEGKTWATDDPLGVGGLLWDLSRVAQLRVHGFVEQGDLLEILLASSLVSLESYARGDPFMLPVDYRLAFRELGLSIGLGAAEFVKRLMEKNSALFRGELSTLMEGLERYKLFKDVIEQFWLTPVHREASSWIAHQDINTVMLATSLAPGGFVNLEIPRASEAG